jgi:hypothetical protein
VAAGKMDIFITLDYEIYFGRKHGTVDRCIIEPTNQLIAIAAKHNVRFSFFVDCGFILKLDEFRTKYPVLEKDYSAIVNQVKSLASANHDIQLHIHPHWEDSYYDGSNWIIKTERYKLADFSDADAAQIVQRYVNDINAIAGKKVFVNRAGGWCIQPFEKVRKTFMENGVTVDSSVFRNGSNLATPYNYDFTDAPEKTSWTFDSNPIREQANGPFKEVAISSIKVSPLFYWKLFLNGRLNPALRKPLGDGQPIASPGYRKKLLTAFTQQPVSIDGDNVKLLTKAMKQTAKLGQEFVIMGHPKALSPFSLKALDKFIGQQKSQHHFVTYTEYFNR